ncbi:MAG: hypothetical protein J6Q17_07510, partial [Clostridia bacterium]|nr:hypothetical protein [Clostridia bacterium]
PLIERIEANAPAVISFFRDGSGTEHLVLVNASQKKDGVYKIFFDRGKVLLEELLYNGVQRDEYAYGNTEAGWDGLWLYPGQMAVYKIARR